jgi:hypothetical protein
VFAEGSTRVERSQLGNDAGLYGAAGLALQADELRAAAVGPSEGMIDRK